MILTEIILGAGYEPGGDIIIIVMSARRIDEARKIKSAENQKKPVVGLGARPARA